MNENLDPRAAAEEIGYTFLPSVLIGLSNAPDIVELPAKNELISLIKKAEFKRKQAPPILKLSSQSLGSDWRIPIAISY